jgi:hypothetical protein
MTTFLLASYQPSLGHGLEALKISSAKSIQIDHHVVGIYANHDHFDQDS